jgi:hypothetical protein
LGGIKENAENRSSHFDVSSVQGSKERGGVSDCIETPHLYVANSLCEYSKQPSVHGGYRFLIIRFAVQNTL